MFVSQSMKRNQFYLQFNVYLTIRALILESKHWIVIPTLESKHRQILAIVLHVHKSPPLNSTPYYLKQKNKLQEEILKANFWFSQLILSFLFLHTAACHNVTMSHNVTIFTLSQYYERDVMISFCTNFHVKTGICMIFPENSARLSAGGRVQWLFGQCPNELLYFYGGASQKFIRFWVSLRRYGKKTVCFGNFALEGGGPLFPKVNVRIVTKY